MSSVSERQNLQKISESCRTKYPNMVPIRIQVQQGLICLKNKFLISQKIIGLELQRNILKFVEKQLSQTLYFFVVDRKKHRMLQKYTPIGDTFNLYKNQQGFLHIKVMKENVF